MLPFEKLRIFSSIFRFYDRCRLFDAVITVAVDVGVVFFSRRLDVVRRHLVDVQVVERKVMLEMKHIGAMSFHQIFILSTDTFFFLIITKLPLNLRLKTTNFYKLSIPGKARKKELVKVRKRQFTYCLVIDDHPILGVVVVDADTGVDATLEHEGSHGRGDESDAADIVTLGIHEQPEKVRTFHYRGGK